MLKLKSCPRCHGDMVHNTDEYGDYEECLQCGFVRDLEGALSTSKERYEEGEEDNLALVALQGMANSFAGDSMEQDPERGAGGFSARRPAMDHAFAPEVEVSELCLRCQNLQVYILDPLGFACYERHCSRRNGHWDPIKPLLVCSTCGTELTGTYVCLDCDLLSHCECHGELFATENCQASEAFVP